MAHAYAQLAIAVRRSGVIMTKMHNDKKPDFMS